MWDGLSADSLGQQASELSRHLSALRTALSRYVPHHLLDRIALDPGGPQSYSELLEGAVLFADVSGFTDMSEKLQALGREGAEEITFILNDYFESMLTISDRFGGDLLKFGGDALLIFFEGREGPARAITASREMQQAMSAYARVETSQGVFPLRMKTGIGSGRILLTTLGSPHAMNYAVSGAALAQMARAEQAASAGQTVVDETTRRATDATASYEPAGDLLWRLTALHSEAGLPGPAGAEAAVRIASHEEQSADPMPALLAELRMVENLSPFVPDELLQGLISDPVRPLQHGTHRPVTVMFANFAGAENVIEALAPEAPEAATAILNAYYTRIGSIIAEFGGTVSRVDNYGGGHRILALFGALRAHEDDPQRAVAAGMEMYRGLAEVNRELAEILEAYPALNLNPEDPLIRQRIGINSGFVFAGDVGGERRREFTVMGDQVNLTARIMSVAKFGQVLLGQSTRDRAASVCELEPQAAVQVKGKTDPVQTYRVTAMRDERQVHAGLPSAPIVGRQRELDQAHTAIDRALRAEAGVMMIRGPSGIGKSRLLDELIEIGKSAGMDMLMGSSLSYGQNMTYHPWLEILRELLGVPVEAETEVRIAAVERGLEAIGESEWAPIMGTVLGLEIPETPLTRALDAKLRRQRVFDLTLKLVQARAGSRPVLLAMEDSHWADASSRDLIDYLTGNVAGHPILVVLAYREDPDLPGWSLPDHAVDLPLGELSPKATMELARQMLGPVQLPETWEEQLIQKAGGNPLFIRELIQAFIDQEALRQDEHGAWEVAEDRAEVEIPDTIHGIINSRLDRLAENDRRVLQAASVIGRDFASRTLAGVQAAARNGQKLRGQLQHLAELGLLEPIAAATADYRFSHLTTREVVYESLPFQLRRDLHFQIGEFIESSYADSLGEHVDLLAHHYFTGQAWRRALDYKLEAARGALGKYANQDAIASARHALEAATQIEGEAAEINSKLLAAHELLGEVFTIVGQYEQALEHYGAARVIVQGDRLPGIESNLRLAELFRATAGVYERRSEFDVALEWVERGLEQVADGELTIERIRLLVLKAGIFSRLSRYEEAAGWAKQSLEQANNMSTFDGKQAVAQIHYLLGGIYNRLGALDRAVGHCESSVEAYGQIDDVVGQARAYNNLGSTYRVMGDWDQARQALHQSLEFARRTGDIQQLGFVTNNLGNIYLDQGNWQRAAEQFQESNSIWRRLGTMLPEAATLSNLGETYVHLSELKEARDALSTAQQLYSQAGTDTLLPELDRRWAQYELARGKPAQALEAIQRSVALARKQEALFELGVSLRVLAEIEMTREEFHAAGTALRESLAILQAQNSDYEIAKVRVVEAKLVIASGERADPESIEWAIGTFKRLGARQGLEELTRLAERLEQPGS